MTLPRFLTALAAAGLLALAGLVQLEPGFDGWGTFLVLAGVIVAVAAINGSVLRGGQGVTMSGDELVIIAAAFVVAPLTIVAAVVVALLIADLFIRHVPPVKALFNLLAYLFETCVVLGVFVLLSSDGPRAIVAALVAGVVFMTLNCLVLALLFRTIGVSSVPEFLRQDLSMRLLHTTFNVAAGAVIGAALASYGIIVVPVAAVAVVAAQLVLASQARSHAQRDELAELVEASSEGICSIAYDGRVVTWNPAMESLVGLAGAEALGRPLVEVLASVGVVESKAVLDDDLDVLTLLVADGEKLLRVRRSTLPGQKTMFVVRDVTAPQRAADALRLGHDRLRYALGDSVTAAWEWSEQSSSISWAENLGAICGRARKWKPTKAEFETIVHPDDLHLVRQAFADPLPARETFDYAYRVLWPDGSVHWHEVKARALGGEDGQRRIRGVTRDVTVERELEERLRQAQKMEAVGQLAGGIAHDFNNLLTVINGYANFTLDSVRAGEMPDPEQLEEVVRSGARAAELTGQLLAFSRRQVLRPRVVALDDVITGLQRLLKRVIGEHIHLTSASEGPPWRIKADPAQVEQILLNLCVNARDAMPDGGLLTITTSNETLAAIDGLAAGDYVAVRVTDTGGGISREHLARIFEPFFTTKEIGQGTGLGLATAYGIARQSDGTLTVQSEPGAGATFTLYLPRTHEAVEAEAVVPAIPRGDETVLLVEDDAAVRALTCDLLRKLGYHVLEAAGPLEARTVADGYDLLLTDIVMHGQNGLQLAGELAAARQGLKTVFMSGYPNPQGLDYELGDLSYLQKPFSEGELAHAVRRALDADRSGGRAASEVKRREGGSAREVR